MSTTSSGSKPPTTTAASTSAQKPHAPRDHQAARQTLDPKKFVRVHRSIIVNVDEVREILRDGRGESYAVLASGQRLKMSKAGWQNLLALGRNLKLIGNT